MRKRIMRSVTLKEVDFRIVSLLKNCAEKKDLHEGNRLYDEILKRGTVGKSPYVSSTLINMFAKCGALEKAHQVLDELPVRDVISWSALIAGYTQHGRGNEALDCFEQMQCEGLSPDAVTFACLLKACGITGALSKGRRIHEDLVSKGLLDNNIILGTALVDMYVKCDALGKAEQVLKQLSVRDVVAWSAIIAGYAHRGQCNEALNCFKQMQTEDLCPDAITFTCILKACGSIGVIDRGKQIHEEISVRGLLKEDIMLGNALVDMYAKCGYLGKAREVLEELPVQDVVSWNALIAGFIQQGQHDEALECFRSMQSNGPTPDSVTFICILKACGSMGAIYTGEEIHNEIISRGLLQEDVAVGTALVDMYGKCGVPLKAQRVHEVLGIKNVVSWTAVIAGYAQQGQGLQALDCFDQMQNEGILPNEITFTCVLNACSHSGLLDEARTTFEDMSRKHGIIPSIEHQTCMVVIFGCAGCFDDAMSVIEMMRSSDHHEVWLALLGACRKWANVKLGTLVFDQAVQLDSSSAAAYVLMGNIFSDAGMYADAEKIEAMRLRYGAWKKKGSSIWVDKRGNVHSFSVGDTKHHQKKNIYSKLELIAHKILCQGYGNRVSQDISVHRMEEIVCMYGENLAISCALTNTYEWEIVHVLTNMNISDDCRNIISLISKIEERRIVVRDPIGVHVFEDGKLMMRTLLTVPKLESVDIVGLKHLSC